MPTEKKEVKVRDMKPSKDAKGGRGAALMRGGAGRNQDGRGKAGRATAGRSGAGRASQ